MSLLVVGMMVMSLADLVLTLTYMKSTGMLEANPIARAMVAIGGEGQLIRYKLFTIAVSCGILYILRRHRAAEWCAWGCCIGMLALSMHWARYNDAILAQGPAERMAVEADGWFVYLGD